MALLSMVAAAWSPDVSGHEHCGAVLSFRGFCLAVPSMDPGPRAVHELCTVRGCALALAWIPFGFALDDSGHGVGVDPSSRIREPCGGRSSFARCGAVLSFRGFCLAVRVAVALDGFRW